MSDHRETNQFPLSLIVDVFSSMQKRELPCQFMLVLTGLPTLVPKLNEARTYTERMFHTLVLDRLSDDDARKAIAQPIQVIQSTLTFSEPAIQRIMAESKGYPFLIQYICKEVFDAWIGKMTVGAVPTVSMTEIVAKLDQDFFAPRWNRATDRQQTFMQVIATLPNSNEEFSIQEITSASRDLLRKAFNPSHATQMLGHLAEKGLIYRNRRGSYCFACRCWRAISNGRRGIPLLGGNWLLSPALICRFFGDVFPLLSRHTDRSCVAAFPAKLSGSGALALFLWRRLPVLNLTSRHVHYELG